MTIDKSLNPKVCIIVSIIAAILGCIADILLLYEPNAHYENADYQFLLNISQQRLYIGSILGVITIPIYLSGLYIICNEYIKNTLMSFISFMCCVIIAVIGCVYHSSIPLVGYILKHSENPLQEIDNIRFYFDPYAAGLTITFFIACTTFGYLMFVTKQWLLVLVNPIVTYVACISLYIMMPNIGRILLPTGFNLSIAVLMTGVYHVLYSNGNGKLKAK
eukprot:102171_1